MNTLAEKLIDITSQFEQFSPLQEEVKTICNYLDYPNLRVAVFAPFNHGKSTLLNALVGSRALPIALIPTTGTAITIKYGENIKTSIRLSSGSEIERQGTDILQEYAILDGDRRMRDDVVSVEVFCPHPLLTKGVELIDLPGTDDMEAQDELVYNQLLSADLIISVLDARKLLTMGEVDNLQEWLLNRGIKTAIFVLNFTNLIEQVEERKDILHRARLIASEFRGSLPNNISNLYQVDALPALRAKVKGDFTLAAQSGIVTFEDAFYKIIDLLLPQVEELRLPRLKAMGDRFKKSLNRELENLQTEISMSDRDRNAEIEQGRNEVNQLKETFEASIKIFKDWLNLENLVSSYQTQIASALENNSFSNWETGTFQGILTGFQQDIQKYARQACDRLGKTQPQILSISLPPQPKVNLPSKPSGTEGNAGTVTAGAVIGGIIGSVIPGIGTWIGASIGAGLAHADSEGAKKEWAEYYTKVSQSYKNTARDYLDKFTKQACSQLQKYQQNYNVIFIYNPSPESPEILDKRKLFSQLQANLSDLETELTPNQTNLVLIQLNGKFGYIRNGKVIIPPQFDYAEDFDQGLAHVQKDGKLYLINTSGKIIASSQLDEFWEWNEENTYDNYKKLFLFYQENNLDYFLKQKFPSELIPVTRNGEFGFIKINGKFISRQFDFIGDFVENFARVIKEEKWGYINTSGELITPCHFDSADDFSEGLARVEKARLYGYINTTGKLIIPCQFAHADRFSEGLAQVEKDGLYGLINTTGKLITPCQFMKIRTFSEGFASVRGEDGLYGYIDTSGQLVISCQFDYAENFAEGLAPVRKNGLYGYINTNGQLVIPYQFERAGDFSEGLAKAEKKAGWGYIDTNGTVVIPHQFDSARNFTQGLAKVRKNGLYSYINTSGQLVMPCHFGDVQDFSQGLIAVQKDNKWGYMDKNGNLIIPYQFDFAKSFEEGLAKVRIDSQEHLIDKTGKIVY